MAQDDKSAQDTVREFYDGFGWKREGERSGEDNLFRKFPESHRTYAHAVEKRLQDLFVGRSGSLLIVGCGDLPDNHLEIIRQFSKVACMDISESAIEITRNKLGPDADYHVASIIDPTLPSSQFEAVFCAHVVYHIDAAQQEAAVRQMLRLVKPGGRVVIVYANPRSPFAVVGGAMRALGRAVGRRRLFQQKGIPDLYYHAHPRGWWRRFETEAIVSFIPWEVIGSRPARTLLRGDSMARAFFRAAGWVEHRLPSVAVRIWQYPILVLDKRS